MSQKELSRRDFLRRTSVIGAVAVGSSALISACGGGQEQAAPAAMEEAAPAGEPMAEAAGCTDVSGLTDAEVQMRETLQYADVSPKPEQVCSGCQLYIEAAAGATCGGCQIVKGPIAPAGYCTSWAEKVV